MLYKVQEVFQRIASWMVRFFDRSVITSYSIHYRKLYDKDSDELGAGDNLKIEIA